MNCQYRKMCKNETRRELEKLMRKKSTVCLLFLKNRIEVLDIYFLVNCDNSNKSIGEYYAYEDALKRVKTITEIMN